MKHNYMLSVMALLLLVAPFCHAQDDASSPSEPTTKVWSKFGDDVHDALTEITTPKGWQKPLDITERHGFTTKAVQLLWDNCKPQMVVVGSTVLVIVWRLKVVAAIFPTLAAVAYAARLGLDRYR
jgi:hypothetical protein